MDKFFFGSAISSVDERGAIVLQADFIETLKARQADGVMFIGRHQDGQRLVIYDTEYFNDQQARTDGQNGSLGGGRDDQDEQYLLRTFTFVDKVKVSDRGEIFISPIMRERGRIGSGVLIVGVGHRLELWDLHAVVERGPYDLRWVAQRHLRAQALAGQDATGAKPDGLSMPVTVPAIRQRRATRLRPTQIEPDARASKMLAHRSAVGGGSR